MTVSWIQTYSIDSQQSYLCLFYLCLIQLSTCKIHLNIVVNQHHTIIAGKTEEICTIFIFSQEQDTQLRTCNTVVEYVASFFKMSAEDLPPFLREKYGMVVEVLFVIKCKSSIEKMHLIYFFKLGFSSDFFSKNQKWADFLVDAKNIAHTFLSAKFLS